jgi:hypothetical protein
MADKKYKIIFIEAFEDIAAGVPSETESRDEISAYYRYGEARV